MSNAKSTSLQNTPCTLDLSGLRLFTPESPNRVAIDFTPSPNFDSYTGRLHHHVNKVGNTLDIALHDFFNLDHSSPAPSRHDDENDANIAYLKAVVGTMKVVEFSRLDGDDSRARRCENGDRGLGCRFCDDKEARHFTMNKKNFLTLQYLNSVTNHIAEKCKSASNNDKNELIRLRDRCKNRKLPKHLKIVRRDFVDKVWEMLHQPKNNDCHIERNQFTHLMDEHDEVGKEQERGAVIESEPGDGEKLGNVTSLSDIFVQETTFPRHDKDALKRNTFYANDPDVAVELLRKSLSDEGSFLLGKNILSLKKVEESSAPSSVLFFTQHEMYEDEVDLTENDDILKHVDLNIIGTWEMKFSGEDNKGASIQIAAKKESDIQDMQDVIVRAITDLDYIVSVSVVTIDKSRPSKSSFTHLLVSETVWTDFFASLGVTKLRSFVFKRLLLTKEQVDKILTAPEGSTIVLEYCDCLELLFRNFRKMNIKT